MTTSQSRKDALRVLIGSQTRTITNHLGFRKNERSCPICLEDFWCPSDDASLYEPALKTACCRTTIGADCLRLFLSPASEGGGGGWYCPICYQPLLDRSYAESEELDLAQADDLKGIVKAFARKRTKEVQEFRDDRAFQDCALYQELYNDGNANLPGPMHGENPFFESFFPKRQKKGGLDVHQAHAMFLQLQREGAFVPIDGKTCAIADSELYKNLRKVKMNYVLKHARWENADRQPVFVSRWGYFGTMEQLALEDRERLKKESGRGERPPSRLSHQTSQSQSSRSSPLSRRSRPSRDL